jgi:hypothetical protein
MSISFQASSTIQGKWWVDTVKQYLEDHGWNVIENYPSRCVDIRARHSDYFNGEDVNFLCCGSMRGKVPGLLRTDSLKKIIANAWFLKSWDKDEHIFVVSNHYPTKGLGYDMLEQAIRTKLFQTFEIEYEE